MQKVAVLILAFNNVPRLKKALASVREYHPQKLYLTCDGPRDDNAEDKDLVQEVQKTMMSSIDWPCEVKTLYRERNLGCDKAIYEAINWFFENEEYGIIVEDDVILSPDFFKLCEELLPRYEGDEKVMEISARNHSGRHDINNSYVYVQSMYNWGWATWRRAWIKIHNAISENTPIPLSFLIRKLGLFRGIMMNHYFLSLKQEIASDSTWDTHWFRCILMNDGLVIVPGVNLALNIGMDDGTHYSKGMIDPYTHLEMMNIEWPIAYNDTMKVDNTQRKLDNRDFLRLRLIGIKNRIIRWKKQM